jgi:hypothetical protein
MTCANIMIVGGGARELAELADSMGDLFVASPLRGAGSVEDAMPRPIQFARITVGYDLALHLYLIAGDRKFSFIWGVLARDMAGYILLVNGQTRDGLAAARQTHLIVSRACRAPYVVAVTDEERDVAAHQSAVAQALNLGPSCQILPCNCADRASMKRVLNALLREMMQTMERAPQAQALNAVESGAAV